MSKKIYRDPEIKILKSIFLFSTYFDAPDLCFPFPNVGKCFDVAGTYELVYKVIGADLFDASTNTSKSIEWKKTYIVMPAIAKEVEIHKGAQSSASATHALLSLGCEKESWLQCSFQDEFGFRTHDVEDPSPATLGGEGSGKKGKGKQGLGISLNKGNLCRVLAKSVKLEFHDVKPAGLKLEGQKREPAHGDEHTLSWDVKITPTSQDCAALKILQEKAGQQIQCEWTTNVKHYH